MDNIIISAVTSAVIAFIIGTLVGEPVKYFFKRLFHKGDIAETLKSIAKRIRGLMPTLLLEMKTDALANPTNREFIVMNKGCIYNGCAITYYFEDHEDLKGKLNILENYKLIEDITYNNTDRYRMTEDFNKILVKHI